MSLDKRRDTKGRILRPGESQLKDGRYRYKYTDTDGSSKYTYSWYLTPGDVKTSGTQIEQCLREKEMWIQRDLAQSINHTGGNISVLELVEHYLRLKTSVRINTKINYKFVLNILDKEAFCRKCIRDIRISDAKYFLIKLQQVDGRGYSSIQSIRGVLRPAFQLAVDDQWLPKNPFDFPLSVVVINDSVTRDAITPRQMRLFLEFIKNDAHFNKYYEAIFILFHTGMRISEFTGLTIKDLDMVAKRIHIERQLQRDPNMKMYITPPKTSSGRRVIPMSNEVYMCFMQILKRRGNPTIEPIVDGYSGFLYLDKDGKPLVALHWEKYFNHIIEKYNKTFKEELPNITPHVCRHTYCSRMAGAGMNPKTLQYLIGHSDISVTLNTYTHLTYDEAEKEVNRIDSIQV